MAYLAKAVIVAIVVVIISEVSKRSSFIGALIASVPMVAVLSMILLYVDTKSIEKVTALSTSVFWLVIPSLALFVSLPVLLKNGVNFYISMTISVFITIACYSLMVLVLGHFGIKL